MTDDGRTEQQRAWVASVRRSLAEKTGRSLAEWIDIARACPEEKPRARLGWMKTVHGLGQNYASIVFEALREADGAAPPPAALWDDPAAAALRDAIQIVVDRLDGVVTGRRKTFTGWSRRYAFAAARPLKDGSVRIGVALPPDASPRLAPPARESWSERLTATLTIVSADAIDDDLAGLLAAAHARS